LAQYLDLADYLLIAEAVLGIPAETIARWPGVGLAESALHAPAMGFGGVEFYPDVIDKAAVLCVRPFREFTLRDLSGGDGSARRTPLVPDTRHACSRPEADGSAPGLRTSRRKT
jgi:death-on-curing protein